MKVGAHGKRGNGALNARRRRSRKQTLIARDGRACWLCGAEMADADMTVDHVVKLVDGGSNLLPNLRLAHARCNNERP